jgi:hypothetical protein
MSTEMPKRDLVATINEMLALVPESAAEMREGLTKCIYNHQSLHASEEDTLFAVARILCGLDVNESWHDDVMSVWAGERLEGEAALQFFDAAGSSWIRDVVKVQPCADCKGAPALFLFDQGVTKCVRCFLQAAMNHPCFKCQKNPTEAIVRAISTNNEYDTVGVCMACLASQYVSTLDN